MISKKCDVGDLCWIPPLYREWANDLMESCFHVFRQPTSNNYLCPIWRYWKMLVASSVVACPVSEKICGSTVLFICIYKTI
jgi:hypothetical protein